MSRSWAGGSTTAWRRVRAAILARDNNLCQINITGVCTTNATCVHHTVGKAFGDSPKHLVAACQPCNLKVGQPGHTTPHKPTSHW